MTTTPQRLPAEGLKGQDGKDYYPDPGLLAAAAAALTLEMPLLLTGEAGCGKTDFAHAAASGLGVGKALVCNVRSDSRARDLLYQYDALGRFGDAQYGGEAGRLRASDPRPYLRLEALGQALISPGRRVVLIDEIDKAPRDLPNDLLFELDRGEFEIPEIPDSKEKPEGFPVYEQFETYRREMKAPDGAPRPFVVITSNVERQLPIPFLRRCVFFHIPFPKTERLQDILRAWLKDGQDLLVERAVEVFETLRAVDGLVKKPATSELIRWALALKSFHPGEESLGLLRPFTAEVISATGEPRAWGELPALGCLIKLKEDLDLLGATEA